MLQRRVFLARNSAERVYRAPPGGFNSPLEPPCTGSFLLFIRVLGPKGPVYAWCGPVFTAAQGLIASFLINLKVSAVLLSYFSLGVQGFVIISKY